jgi:hypothetical protein
MHNEFLTVVLAETLPGVDATYASNQIFQQMAAVFGLRLYAVAICQTGSLPRMSVGPQYSTEFTTPYNSYCPGIIEGVILPMTSELPQFGYHSRKTGSLVLRSNSLDSEVCRKDFVAGHLFVTYMAMNATPDIISPITLGMTVWDDPAVHSDRRQIQVVQRVGGYKVLDDKSGRDLQGFPDLPHILEWRLSITPELPAFTLLDGRGREQKQVSFRKVSNRAYSLAHYLIKKKEFLSGECVMVMMTLGLDFIYTIHACLFCGLIPIPFR